jgi:phosphoketolase
MNDLDRFHLVEDVIDRLPQLSSRAAYFKLDYREGQPFQRAGLRRPRGGWA